MPRNTPEFDQPLVSVDVVPVWVDVTGRAFFGVGARMFEPFKGDLALPGVLMGHERSADAAGRALRSKVGVDPESVLLLRDAGVFDSAERDPRGPTLSIAKVAVIPGGVARAAVAAGTMVALPLVEAQDADLPFDHARIATEARQVLSGALWSDPAVLRALLPDGFSTAQATALNTDLRGEHAHPSNVRRRIEALKGVVPDAVEERGARGSRMGRLSRTWTWED